MTDLQLFAFVYLPIGISVGAWVFVLIFERFNK